MIYHPSSFAGYRGQSLENPSVFRMLGAEVIPRAAGGSTSNVQFLDSIYTRYTDADTWNDYALVPFVGIAAPAPVYESLTPSVATVDSSGLVTRVSDGTATVRCTIGGVTKTKQFVFETVEGGTTDIWAGFATDSLAYHLSQQVDTRLAGKSAATALRVFTTQNHGTSTYVRNPNFWAADRAQALSCVSVWNSRYGAVGGGYAFTLRHFAHAAHLPLFAGDTVRFVLSDNTVVQRTIVGAANAVNAGDMRIATLNSDLPETIPPAKVLPSNIRDYLPRLNLKIRVPGIFFDQEEKGTVQDIFSIPTEIVENIVPLDEKRREFWEQPIGGDSGNGGGNFVEDEFVGFGTGFHWANLSPSTAQNAAINAAILASDASGGVSTGYTCTPVDLGAFPTY